MAIGLAVTLAMTVAGMFIPNSAAHAALPEGVTSVTWLHNGSGVGPNAEVKHGDQIGVHFTVNQQAAGQEVTFDFDDPVVVPDSITNAISFVESIVTAPDEGTVTVTFGDIPDQSMEGSFQFAFQYEGDSGDKDLEFTFGDEKRTISVVVVKKGDDKFSGSAGVSKSGPGNVTNKVEINGEDVSLASDVKDLKFDYTLVITYDGEGDAPAMTFKDALPDGMEYVAESFVLTHHQWDENGYNKTSTDSAISTLPGNNLTEFDYTYVPASTPEGPFQLVLKYQAKLTNDGITAIEDQLQGAFENLNDSTSAQHFFSDVLKNTATIGGTDKSAQFQFRGTKPGGPGVGTGDFNKRQEGWDNNSIVDIDEEGNLTPPGIVTYRFKVSWGNWDGDSKTKDITITDALPEGIEWDTSASDFLQWGVESGESHADQTLDKVDDCTTAPAAGEYCIDGDDDLTINLGSANAIAGANDDATTAYVYVKANVVSVNPDKEVGDSGLAITDLKNDATFSVGGENKGTGSASIKVNVRGDGPVKDKDLFSKTGSASSGEAEVGGTVTFDYTLRVAKGAGIDAKDAYIVDYIDPIPEDLFGLDEDLDNVIVTMTYDGESFDSDDFTVALNDDGDLQVELTEAGKDRVGNNVDKEWITKISLETRELQGDDGRETVEVTNKASVFSDGSESFEDDSGTSSSSSYGNGLELAKRVFDCKADVDAGDNPWKQSVTAWIGEDGTLVNDTFVFRLELLPHGTYGSTGLIGPNAINFNDELPEGLSFEGFVDPEDLDCDPGVLEGAPGLPGNLEVNTLDGGNGVNITVKGGERFQSNAGPFYVYIAAKVDEDALDRDSLTNVFGKSEARVEIKEPSIWLEKWTTEDGSDGPDFDADGHITNDGYDGDFDDPADPKTLIPLEEQTIFFTVSNNGEENLVNFKITDEILQGEGEVGDLVCEYPDVLRPGEQFECEATFSGISAGATHQNRAKVTAEGEESRVPVEDSDDWNAKTDNSYAIGDYVWIDSDRDGVQGDDEDPLEGVTVTLADGDGNSVKDVFGDDVDPVETDENGLYLFDNLPAGEYKVHFELTDAQKVKYLFTEKNSDDANSDSTDDSDANPSSGWTSVFALNADTPGLTTDYTDQEVNASAGIDPTWDAGVIERSYAIGDYVWIDSDRDGLQGDDEEPLEGVLVTIVDVDGEPVTDVNGDEVDYVFTDSEGRYLFDNLPAGDYRVNFMLTDEQAEKYIFTELNVGDDVTVDSDADRAGWTEEFTLDGSNSELTNDYDRTFGATEGVDPTWDAGVILKSVSVGDYVWVDENRDGIQDEGEPGIPGVTLCLVGPDGEPVTDVFGDLVGPVVTDENGYYSFDDLPALSGEETYTVCIDREASEEVLKPYVPTKEHQGDDRGLDSSTWEASTEPGDLHNDGDRDPTLDFGFVTKSYAIGDYVWIDSNRDGIQDEGEDPLPGVTVELFDSEGDLVDSTTTDDEGRYLFDNLPAGEYKVKFTLTDEQAAIYDFTTLNTGNSESTNDSDADPATGWTTVIVLDDSNTSLTGEYDRAIEASEGVDPTWDAGVVLKPLTPEEGPGPDPTPEQTPDPEPTPEGEDIPSLGAEFNGTLVGIAVALLLAGAATVALVRRES